MTREIERRFLVHPQKLPKLSRGQKIGQTYFSVDPAVRVRIKSGKAYIGIKKRQNFINLEFEYRIPLKEAKKLMTLSKLKIVKTRYLVNLNSHKWEVDVFAGKNKGLIIAELELPSLSKKFQKPLWIGLEITKDDRYLNVNLAQKPYQSW